MPSFKSPEDDEENEKSGSESSEPFSDVEGFKLGNRDAGSSEEEPDGSRRGSFKVGDMNRTAPAFLP